jgi:hypothetical protein
MVSSTIAKMNSMLTERKKGNNFIANEDPQLCRSFLHVS